jgi:hypothetical protein
MNDPEEIVWVFERRVDGEQALLISESGEERTVSLAHLPRSAEEGYAFREVQSEDGVSTFVADEEAWRRLRDEVAELRSSLRKGPSGSLSL